MTKKTLEESTKNRWKELAGINEVSDFKRKELGAEYTDEIRGHSGYVDFNYKGIIIRATLDKKYPTSFTKGKALISWPGKFFADTKIVPITINQTTSQLRNDKEGVPSRQVDENGQPLFYLKNAEEIFSKKGKYIGELPPEEQKAKKEREKMAIKSFRKEISKDFMSPTAIPKGEINQ